MKKRIKNRWRSDKKEKENSWQASERNEKILLHVNKWLSLTLTHEKDHVPHAEENTTRTKNELRACTNSSDSRGYSWSHRCRRSTRCRLPHRSSIRTGRPRRSSRGMGRMFGSSHVFLDDAAFGSPWRSPTFDARGNLFKNYVLMGLGVGRHCFATI